MRHSILSELSKLECQARRRRNRQRLRCRGLKPSILQIGEGGNDPVLMVGEV